MQSTLDDDNAGKLTFSIIIPVWPEDPRPYGLDYIDKLNWPKKHPEVILARGYQPCRQRNQAAKEAKGEILVFFDDDSCPEPDFLKKIAPHFADPNIVGVCGPKRTNPPAKQPLRMI